LLGNIEAKNLDVADLLAACNKIRTLKRLEDLPIFELALAKKKKEKNKGEINKEI